MLHAVIHQTSFKLDLLLTWLMNHELKGTFLNLRLPASLPSEGSSLAANVEKCQ